MTDAYFDELGVAWRANIPDVDALTMRLRASLRRQSLINRAVITLEVALTILGIALGAILVWKGVFGQGLQRDMAAGLLVILVTAIAAALSLWVLHGENGDAESLPNMVDLAISRAERSIRRVRAILLACVVLPFYTAAMWFVGPTSDNVPREVGHRSLLVATIFGIIWAGAWSIWAIYRSGRAQQELAKFRHLKRVLVAD